ncbi:hypothetical protein HDU81_001258 [Chytriomyces hyalinus]|nr:hypothetical protein HDU81_001258 [Chytriomyces hyalinus]
MASDSDSSIPPEREKHRKHSRKDKDKKKHKSKSKKEKKDKSAKKSHNKRSHSDHGSDSDSDSGESRTHHKKKSSKKEESAFTAWMHDDSDLRQPAKPANSNQPIHQHQPDLVERKASVDSIPKQRRPSVPSSRKSVMAPQRPEEYLAEMNKLRREVDPMTGRTRLIKGTGEIVEEIVTKKQHVEVRIPVLCQLVD